MRRIAVNLILLTLLSAAGVWSGYRRLVVILEQSGVRAVAPDRPVASAMQHGAGQGTTDQKRDYSIILRRNIFGAGMEGETPATPEKEERLAETKLRLALQGTVTGSKQDARAIIFDETTRRQGIYHIGDRVQGALITAIQRGKVIIRVRGRNEVLHLKKRKSPPGSMVQISGQDPGVISDVVPERLNPVPHRRTALPPDRSGPPGAGPPVPPGGEVPPYYPETQAN